MTTREVLPGIALRRTPGHTPHHQGILVTSGSERLFYLADLAPRRPTSRCRGSWAMTSSRW